MTSNTEYASPAAGDGAANDPQPQQPPAEVASTLIETKIDPDGDLTLRVGGQTGKPVQSFRVCASALRRSSQVWKKMLFGPFKESKPACGPWLVDLPEDNPDALKILLHIVHANFQLVPSKPSLDELYGTFVLANKYDMISVLMPWARAWVKVVQSFGTPSDGRSIASLMYIAWEMGQIGLQKEMMEHLVLHSSVDKDGRMVTADGVVLDNFDPIGPPGLLEKLREAQSIILRSLPSQLNYYIGQLTSDHGYCAYRLTEPAKAVCCNNIILGSLMRGMARERGSITLTVSAHEGESVAKLTSAIRAIANSISSFHGHPGCSPATQITIPIHNSRNQLARLDRGDIAKMEKRQDELRI